MASTGSCRMRAIGGVWMVELVLVGRLLLAPVQRSVGYGFTGRGESDLRVVRTGT